MNTLLKIANNQQKKKKSGEFLPEDAMGNRDKKGAKGARARAQLKSYHKNFGDAL